MKKQIFISLLLVLGTQHVALPIQNVFTIENVTSTFSLLKNGLAENTGLKCLGSVVLGAYLLQNLVVPDKQEQEQKKGLGLYKALEYLKLGALISFIPYAIYKTYGSDGYWQGFRDVQISDAKRIVELSKQ